MWAVNGRLCWVSVGLTTTGTERNNGWSRILKVSQRLFGSINVVGPFAVPISRKHALVELPRFRRLLSLNHHCCSSECAGSSERLGIDRRADRLALYVIAPCLHPRRRFSSRRHHTFKLFN